MGPTGFDLIKKRRAEIERERQSLKTKLAMLDAEQVKLAAEEDELAIAERVLGRLADKPAKAESVTAVSIPKNGTPRPPGIPTVAEMIDMALAEAKAAGKIGLTGRSLLLAIHDRWWPGVGWNNILPTALRLVEKGRLGRESNGIFVKITAANGASTGERIQSPNESYGPRTG